MKVKPNRTMVYAMFGAMVSILLVLGANFTGFFDTYLKSRSLDKISSQPSSQGVRKSFSYDLDTVEVKSGDNLFNLLRKKCDVSTVNKIISTFKNLRSPNQLKAGDKLVFYISNHNQLKPTVARVDWKYSEKERISAKNVMSLRDERSNQKYEKSDVPSNLSKLPTYTWRADYLTVEYETDYVVYEGTIEGSLWASGKKNGLPSSHIVALANLFAWEIDFSREVRAGDKWKMVVEQHNIVGENPTLGKIVATHYINKNMKAVAVRWDGNESIRSGYFQPNGESLRRMFLKAPIDFARISSRFNRARFHPILKVRKPHLGVDYAARIGTPVKTIGSGRVIYKGFSPVAGNTLKVKHNATYTTAYKHLNGFAKGIKKGTVVEQGQVIAFVGTTGRSTGPHLHFELKKDGRIIDPLSETFPTADPFPAKHIAEFKNKTAPYLELLNEGLVIVKVHKTKEPN
jgi:murein DD-endopeptidase MepM/ murein hydrolase activator NlpD